MLSTTGVPVQNTSNTLTDHRIDTIDLLRGIVMIIMALDHTRDFFHRDAFTSDPLNLQTTTTAVFNTRWITHFCAPVFVFLSGTSVYLQSLRKSKQDLCAFLIKRGLWLIVADFLVVSFALSFDSGYTNLFFQVIAAIGISMALLGVCIWLPFRIILGIGLVIVAGHNILDYFEGQPGFAQQTWYHFLHVPAFGAVIWNGHSINVLYPFLPWTGLMLLGYCTGRLFTQSYSHELRKKILLCLGLTALALLVALRSFNIYGDPGEWSEQRNLLLSFFSFINLEKYPPSLLFMCATIGPALLFLALINRTQTRTVRIITVYGRVPFFYFLVHLFLIHGLSMLLFFLRGHSYRDGLNADSGFPFNFIIPGEGVPLWVVYLLWIGIVAALYPLCTWYSNYKRNNRKWWLSYL